jgi:quercetin dioxygenase-like cupin family protein
MILNVEGEAIWLQEGDLVTVKPGTCHHFETFDEKVSFLAIKKQPGLDDKKLC